MSCPYLKEVVMLSCDAYPVKKFLPLDRIASANPCLGEFPTCPLYQELAARLAALTDHAVAAPVTTAARKEGSR